jgi:F-type H+-transporting ATPase subunit beta
MTFWGTITSVNNQIVEIHFPDQAPEIYTLLVDAEEQVILETIQSASDTSIYALILKGENHLYAGMQIKNTHTTLTVPVGKQVLGRVISVLGQPEDSGAPLTTKRVPLHQASAITTENIVVPDQILETGIKAIDFFAPVLKGGKVGLFGGAGLGKTILLTELINNIIIRDAHATSTSSAQKRVSVFAAVGERIREVRELHTNLQEANVLNQTALIVGQMGENPAIRFRTASAAVRLAEDFRDTNHDVLFFMDNIYRYSQAGYEISTLMNLIPSEDGYQPNLTSQVGELHERLVSTKNGSITTVEAVYLPSDDSTDYSVRSVMPYLDTVVVLSRDIYQAGRLPAIDILASSSSALQPDLVSVQHFQLFEQSRQLLKQAQDLERIVSLIGINELSPENRTIYNRAELIKNYMTQPFTSVEKQSSNPGVYVPLNQTLADMEAILDGKYDQTDPDTFLMRGALS